MTDETIQTDVSEAESTTAPEPPVAPDSQLSRREAKFAKLKEKRQEQLAEEMEVSREMGNIDAAPPVEEPAVEAEEVAADLDSPESESEQPQELIAEAVEDAPEEPQAPSEEPPQTRQLKVNGRLVELTQEQYEAALQKDLSGDEKLRQAAEAKRNLQRYQQQLEQQAALLHDKMQRAETEQPPQPGVDLEQRKAVAAEAISKLLEGDSDVARDKLVELVTEGIPSVDINEIEERATQRALSVTEERAREREQRAQWNSFAADYQDIVADPVALAAADKYLEAVNFDPDYEDKSYEAKLRRAGELTRERLGSAQPEISVPDTTARQERKSKLKPIPKAKGIAKEKVEEPKVDTSPSAAISRMKQSRAMR